MTHTVKMPYQRWALTGIAALSLLGSAGCAASPTPAPGNGGAAGGDAADTAVPGGGSGDYANGTYSATGSYQTPGGEESIGVTVTLESGAVADVQTEPMPSNGTTELYQGKFSSGIKEQIVGTPLDELSVDKVSGSSLTSGGFSNAIEQIKSEAAQ
ncbi:FMN-binding protein [uncultured Arthrobacter sp.]|uniref:FMN-binding protein n=1 Tax=uncultured Arthrobacter sp. TaxID=114050 RepID=UPI0026356F67|nr:FMN-binding protein [uncultured Arthrobacter sp.]